MFPVVIKDQMDEELQALRFLQEAGYMKGVRYTASTLPENFRRRSPLALRHRSEDVGVPWVPTTSANAKPQTAGRGQRTNQPLQPMSPGMKNSSNVRSARRVPFNPPVPPLVALQEKLQIFEPLVSFADSGKILEEVRLLDLRLKRQQRLPHTARQNHGPHHYSPRDSKLVIPETSDEWVEEWSHNFENRYNLPSVDSSSSDEEAGGSPQSKKTNRRGHLPFVPYGGPLLQPCRELRKYIQSRYEHSRKIQADFLPGDARKASRRDKQQPVSIGIPLMRPKLQRTYSKLAPRKKEGRRQKTEERDQLDTTFKHLTTSGDFWDHQTSNVDDDTEYV